MYRFFLGIVVPLVLLSTTLVISQNSNIRSFERLKNSGVKIIDIDSQTLKLIYPTSTTKRYFSMVDFGSLSISSDIQVLDLTTVDTTEYNWKYIDRKMYAISGLAGNPLIIGDLDRDEKLDIVGSYQTDFPIELADCAIFEMASDSQFYHQLTFTDSVTRPLAITDVDNDGLTEINFRHIQLFDNYEQRNAFSYPDSFNFSHRMWQSGSVIDEETFMDLDGDSITDVLYRGDDTLTPFGSKVYIAEYRENSNSFEQTFRFPPTPDWRVSNFSVGDFDQDGFLEFSFGSIDGNYFIIENTGNDSYQLTAQDTLTISNAYLNTPTNDIDGNGKPEFFLGGSSFFNGLPVSRLYWFEANGNNQYEKVRSFFMLGTDFLGVSRLFTYDVQADGQDDLVFSFPYAIVILTWNRETEQFDLYYYDLWENVDQLIYSINVYDLFGHGKPNLIVSVLDIATEPVLRSYFYRQSPLTHISEPPAHFLGDLQLHQNHPNPFNNSTSLSFRLPKPGTVTLTIYNLTGKEVIRLIDRQFHAPGTHEVHWNGRSNNGKEVSSGLYFSRLSIGGVQQTKKLILVK